MKNYYTALKKGISKHHNQMQITIHMKNLIYQTLNSNTERSSGLFMVDLYCLTAGCKRLTRYTKTHHSSVTEINISIEDILFEKSVTPRSITNRQ